MTARQLQALIAAGVFSASLMAGNAYSEDAATTPAVTKVKKAKHAKKQLKEVAKHSCAGQNSCKGQGGCATDGSHESKAAGMNLPQHACKGQNACKGQGGCAAS